MREPKPITTDEWRKAKLPFEHWLRYAQMVGERKRRVELEFDKRFRREETK